MNIETDNKNTWIIAVVLVAIVCAAGWYLLGYNVSDNGSGADRVRAEQQSAADSLGRASSAISDSQDIANDIEKYNNEARETSSDIADTAGQLADANSQLETAIDNSAGRSKELADSIDSSATILERIRQRGTSEAEINAETN